MAGHDRQAMGLPEASTIDGHGINLDAEERELRAPLLRDSELRAEDRAEAREELSIANDASSTYRTPLEGPSALLNNVQAASVGAADDITTYWDLQRPFFICWIFISSVNFILFTMVDLGTGLFLFAEIASILAIVASLASLVSGLGIDLDLKVKTVVYAGLTSLALDSVTLLFGDTLLLMLLPGCSNSIGVPPPLPPPPPGQEENEPLPACGTTWGFIIVLSILLGVHMSLSLVLFSRARRASQLLNPVSSGLVQV